MKTRVLTSVVGIPAVLALLFWPGGWPWFWFVAALMAMAIYEFTRALWAKGIYVHWIALGLVGALGMHFTYPTIWPTEHILGPFTSTTHFELVPELWTLFVLAMLVGDLAWKRRAPLKNLGATFVGIGWIALTLPFLVRVWHATGYYKILPNGSMLPLGVEIGAWLVLTTLLVIWAGDSGAYFVGKAIGKHKMAPAISPNKTWEGAAGGLAASWAVGAAMTWQLSLNPAMCLLFGLVVGAAGQIGDLVESAIKREIGIKDFGDLLPGHGGVLDRFDSLLFAAPTAHLLTKWFLGANFLR